MHAESIRGTGSYNIWIQTRTHTGKEHRPAYASMAIIFQSQAGRYF